MCCAKVKRLAWHVFHAHIDVLGTRHQCQVWASYGRLCGKLVVRGREVRLCPVDDCACMNADTPRYLWEVHSQSRDESLRNSQAFRKVATMDWTVPTTDTSSNTSHWTQTRHSACCMLRNLRWTCRRDRIILRRERRHPQHLYTSESNKAPDELTNILGSPAHGSCQQSLRFFHHLYHRQRKSIFNLVRE